MFKDEQSIDGNVIYMKFRVQFQYLLKKKKKR